LVNGAALICDSSFLLHGITFTVYSDGRGTERLGRGVSAGGWMDGLDPTLGRSVTTQHVRIAYGRDYGDVPPVCGVYKGHAGQRLSVDVRVRPALDSEGWERLRETAARPVTARDRASPSNRNSSNSE
jgi:hypothetical protein